MYQENKCPSFKCINCGYLNNPFPQYPNQNVYPSSIPSFAMQMPMPNPSLSPSPSSVSMPMPCTPPIPVYPSVPQNFNTVRQNKATVRPYDSFNKEKDAEVLRKAMKGFGTDESAIIGVLANRSQNQRLEIQYAFKAMYGKDLLENLKSELSGNFEKLVLALMKPWAELCAVEINDAIEGCGTNERTLIEILCTATNHQMYLINEAYQRIYGRRLEEDLKDDTSGSLKRLMVSLSMGHRNEHDMLSVHDAEDDARKLLNAGEMRLGTDESTFNYILSQRSYLHLKHVFEAYQRLTGHKIKKAIENEFSGSIKDALLAIVQCVQNRALFFAKEFHRAMKGVGTDDKKLIRLVATRCEIDLGNIKEAYSTKYSKSLVDDVKSEASGHYKKCLVALLEE